MVREPSQRKEARSSARTPSIRPGVRSAMRQIDQELKRVDDGLSGYEQLLRERQRLLAARSALSGEKPPAARARTSQDEVAAYLTDHPGSWPAEIAAALRVPVTNVSQHLYRAKETRFMRRQDGWHVRSGGG
jgi:DNA-directed RNA polymerase specialized sigma24 family protein